MIEVGSGVARKPDKRASVTLCVTAEKDSCCSLGPEGSTKDMEREAMAYVQWESAQASAGLFQPVTVITTTIHLYGEQVPTRKCGL